MLPEDEDLPLEGEEEGEPIVAADEPLVETGEDDRLAEGGEAEGGEGEEGQQGDAGGIARPKKTSKQRRDERRSAERRVREERDFLLQQNAEMMQRLASVETTAIEARLLTVDSRLSECLNDAEQAELLELDALKGNDNQAVLQARRIREKAASQANLFRAEKQRLTDASAQQKTRPAQAAPIPGAAEIAQQAAQFRADKPWVQFAQNGAPLNAETAVAVSVDHALKKEGRLSERDPAYWQELDKRVKAALPHLFQTANTDQEDDEDEDDDFVETATTTQKPAQRQAAKPAVAASTGRKGPAVGSSGRQQNAGASVTRLSPDRVAALKELGVWEDPKERAVWVKNYEDYDRKKAAKN